LRRRPGYGLCTSCTPRPSRLRGQAPAIAAPPHLPARGKIQDQVDRLTINIRFKTANDMDVQPDSRKRGDRATTRRAASMASPVMIGRPNLDSATPVPGTCAYGIDRRCETKSTRGVTSSRLPDASADRSRPDCRRRCGHAHGERGAISPPSCCSVQIMRSRHNPPGRSNPFDVRQSPSRRPCRFAQ